MNELDELDKITYAWIQFNYSLIVIKVPKQAI